LPVIVGSIALFCWSKVQYPHYLLPAFPSLCLLAGVGITWIANRLARSESGRLLAAAALAFALACPSLWWEGRAALAMGVPDTESAVLGWIRSNCAPGTKIGLDVEDLSILPTLGAVERNIAMAKDQGFTGRADYWASLKRLIALDKDYPHY